MCGIIGATGDHGVLDLLLEGLERLEYRGYDSAGVALDYSGGLYRARAATGTRSLEDLRKIVENAPTGVTAGIGHTRWATHGHPTELNAHPHLDCSGRVAVVHNGIIENWRELATRLRQSGHVLASDTDTEMFAHLVEEEMGAGLSLANAVRSALRDVRGAFALAVVAASEPGTIVAAKRVSPSWWGWARATIPWPCWPRTSRPCSDTPAASGSSTTTRWWSSGPVRCW